MSCSLCAGPLGPHGGNNAYPLSLGRCCDSCNGSVILARLTSRPCKGGPGRTFVATQSWDAGSRVGKLVFFAPSHDDFHVAVTVTAVGSMALAAGEELLLGAHDGDHGSVASSHAGASAKVALDGDGQLLVRVDADGAWADCTLAR